VDRISQPVGFGHSIHFCLGAPLARLEGRVVLRVILQRLQNLTLDSGNSGDKMTNLSPLQSIFFHGVAHLPLNRDVKTGAMYKKKVGRPKEK
jgi:cytochrome P450